MKKILCFGDSNTFGLKPDGSGRFDHNTRWTGKLQSFLRDDYIIFEEGLCGRTTIFNDKRPARKGIDYIRPWIESHPDIDLAIIMLGTNDCKTAFNNTPETIAKGIEGIVDLIKSNSSCRIVIISPIHLGRRIAQKDKDFSDKSYEVSTELADEYKKIATENGCDFLDASIYAEPSELDLEHLDEQGHFNLYNAIKKLI